MPEHRDSERGVSLVEFALILPIMLLLTFAVLEIIHATNVNKIAAQLSRESANIVFRECSGDVATQTCLDGQRDSLLNFAKDIEPNAQIILSIFEASTATPPVITLKGTTTSAGYPTRFATNTFNAEVSALPGQTLYVAEIFIPYTPVIGDIPKVFQFNFPLIYDATVM